MIKLGPHPPAPDYFSGKEIQALAQETKNFYETSEKSRRQVKFEFPLLPSKLFRSTLTALMGYTAEKCAYCETPLKFSDNASLERFRPKGGALDRNGKFSIEHYWWLAYEWNNLYAACATCNKLKGAKFPMHGPRCARLTPHAQLASEPRLLLDPAVDDPAEHLLFTETGFVRGISPSGKATIEVFNLNRSPLIRDRRERIARVKRILHEPGVLPKVVGWGADWVEKSFDEILKPRGDKRMFGLFESVGRAAPFAAAARAAVNKLAFGDEAGPAKKPHRAPMAAGPDEAHPAAPSSLHSLIVSRVSVQNFRGIADLDLKIDLTLGSGAPWTVLLGENAAGKSSILQAIALTLATDDSVMPGIRPKDVIRQGKSTGLVRVWFHGNDTPRKLAFRRGGRKFVRSGPPYPGVLLAYGATRLLPQSEHQFLRRKSRIINLFNPFHPLIDVNRFLGRLGKNQFEFVARALHAVLDLPPTSKLRKVRSSQRAGVRLQIFGADLPPEDLSDGYQSMLGLTSDLLSALRMTQKGATDASEAIVLIDELGAHLHPRWRMRIVNSLRTAFKRVQFVASTHDPLCLRGLENGEAIVLKRTARGRVFKVDDLPPIKGMRAEQLLTSEYFGLDSTLDRDVELDYRRLNKLLAKRKPTPEDVEQIAELRNKLASNEVRGATRRERRLLDVINKEIEQLDKTPATEDRVKIREQNDKIMAALLKSVETDRTIQ